MNQRLCGFMVVMGVVSLMALSSSLLAHPHEHECKISLGTLTATKDVIQISQEAGSLHIKPSDSDKVSYEVTCRPDVRYDYRSKLGIVKVQSDPSASKLTITGFNGKYFQLDTWLKIPKSSSFNVALEMGHLDYQVPAGGDESCIKAKVKSGFITTPWKAKTYGENVDAEHCKKDATGPKINLNVVEGMIEIEN